MLFRTFRNIAALLISLNLSHCFIISNFPKSNDVNTILEDLAYLILHRYFAKNKCLVIISEQRSLKTVNLNNTVTYFEIDSEKENCYLKLHAFLRGTFREYCDGYIVQLKDPLCAMKAWEETNKKRLLARHNPKFFFLPFFPSSLTYADKLMSMRITDITQYLLAGEINENVTDWKVTLWTNNFAEHPTKPGRVSKYYLDEWHPKTGLKKNVNLYPDKFDDLRGKPFRVAAADYLPYAQSHPLDGMEVRVAMMFCDKHNCTVEGVYDAYYWGSIYPNLTGNGLLGNVYLDKADIGVLAVYYWTEEHNYIDYSDSYLRGEVTAITPRPGQIGGWLVPFLPFRVEMWGALLACLLLSATSLYFVTKASIKYTRFREQLLKKVQFTTLEDSLMRAIGLVILQQPSSRLIGDSPNRYLFTSFEFVYLVLSAMYSAELASFLTVPRYHKPIDLFDEFAASGMKWFIQHEGILYSLWDSDDPDAKTIVANCEVLPMDELKKLAKEVKYGFTAERCPAGSITQLDHITVDVVPKYHIMKDYLFASPITALMKKGSPYKGHYNAHINKLVEHGFTLFWELEIVRRYMDGRIQNEYKEGKTIKGDDTGPAIITVENVQGVIYLFGLGILLSAMVFVYEIFKSSRDKNKVKKKKNISMNWKETIRIYQALNARTDILPVSGPNVY